MTAPMAGQPWHVGPYRIVRQLGAGGMGAVYLGQHEQTGEPAAVKLIRPEYGADPEHRARLRREVAAARRVPRFCTAPVLAADLDAEPPWVATEYIDAPTLDVVLLERGRLAGPQLEGFAVGVAVALRAIHQHGVIHRDLKPSNVLLTPFGPRVIDFGIARLDDGGTQLTRTGAMVGTPAHLAPEQLRGEPVTPAVDVFAWASLVTYAATGRPPFGTGEVSLQNLLHAPPDLGDLAEPLRGPVLAALDKDPARRPTAADLVDRLAGGATAEVTAQVLAAAQAPATALVPPAMIPAAPPRGRAGLSWRRLWAMAGATTVAAATVTAVSLVALLPGPAPGGGPAGGPVGAPPATREPPELPPFGAPVGDPIEGDPVYAVATIDVAGTPVVLAAGAGEVRLWNLDTREPIGEPIEHGGLMPWSLTTGAVDGVPVAATASGSEVRVWDLTSRQQIGPPLRSAAVTAPGSPPPWFDTVAIGEQDGRPIAVTAGGTALAVWDLGTMEQIGTTGVTTATDRIESVAIGEQDGRPVAVTGGAAVRSTAGVVEVWQLDPVRPVAQLAAADRVTSVATGTVGGRPVAVSAPVLQVWGLDPAEPMGEQIGGSAVAAGSVAIGEAGGAPVAVLGTGTSVWVLLLDTSRLLGPFTGHTEPVTSVAVGDLHGAPVAVSGSSDGTIYVWSLADPDPDPDDD